MGLLFFRSLANLVIFQVDSLLWFGISRSFKLKRESAARNCTHLIERTTSEYDKNSLEVLLFLHFYISFLYSLRHVAGILNIKFGKVKFSNKAGSPPNVNIIDSCRVVPFCLSEF